MKQTAMEWLNEQMKTWGYLSAQMRVDIIERAKAMEKKQIIEAHFAAQKEDLRFWDEAKQEAEQYYNETFKSEDL